MADLLKAWIKKLLGVASPSLHLMGYDYEFDYLMDKRKKRKKKGGEDGI